MVLMNEKEGVDPTKPADALEILRTYNRWRRDEGECKHRKNSVLVPLPFSAGQVGAAIDTAIHILEKAVELK